jgi:hypothetical protein
MAVHTASRRVREKSGLTLVRTVHQAWPDRIPGDEHGDVEYALPRADWEPHEATAHEGTRDHDRDGLAARGCMRRHGRGYVGRFNRDREALTTH